MTILLCPLSYSLFCLKTYLGLLAVSVIQLNLGLHGLDHISSIQNCHLQRLSSA